MAQVYFWEPRPGNQLKCNKMAMNLSNLLMLRMAFVLPASDMLHTRTLSAAKASPLTLHYRDCSLSGMRALVSSSPHAVDMNEHRARHELVLACKKIFFLCFIALALLRLRMQKDGVYIASAVHSLPHTGASRHQFEH